MPFSCSFFILEKAVKGAGNAVIPTFPAHCPHGLQHLRHKRPTFAFTSESGYTLGFRRKIAHKGSQGETGGVLGGGGITTLGAFHTVRKPCVAGYQNGKLCRFWALVVGAPEERRKPSGQRCAYAHRCPEASRPRWAAETYSFVTAWSFLHRYQSGQQLELSIKTIRRPNVHCKTECILLQYSEKSSEWRRYTICPLSLFAMTSRK